MKKSKTIGEKQAQMIFDASNLPGVSVLIEGSLVRLMRLTRELQEELELEFFEEIKDIKEGSIIVEDQDEEFYPLKGVSQESIQVVMSITKNFL